MTMLNANEILDTIRMIDRENLDIRTITMGISLLSCACDDMQTLCGRVYDRICTSARDLVRVGREIEDRYGIPIVNKRVSVTPIALIAGGTGARDYVPVARAMDKAAKELGLNARLSRIASGDQFITARARKQWIVDTFGAMACEMEAGAIAQVCYIAGTKCAVIRAISDATDDAHGMEFFEFAARAAENSIKVLKKALMSEIL
jgi:nucleoside phosphorylase